VYQLLRWGALTFGLAAASCQWVSSVEVYEADPLETGCKLPVPVAGTTGKVRLANLFTSTDRIDLCVRPSGSASYGRPILRTSGRDVNDICGRGLSYAEMTKPFAVPAGTIDAKIIPATKTCSAPAIVETLGITTTTDYVVTLEYMGGAATPASLVPMLESPNPTDIKQNRVTRFVNAVPGTSLLFGVPESGQTELPANLGTALFLKKALEYGHKPEPADVGPGFSGKIDNNGYFNFGSIPLPVVAAQVGNSKALLFVSQTGQGMAQLFAIGDPTSAFPVRGLLCHDDQVNSQTPQLTQCEKSEVETFSIDSFNAGLYGAFARVEDKRAPEVLKALAARGTARSDLLCISEIDRHSDLPLPPDQSEWTQEKLIDLAKNTPGGYQYFVQGNTDQNTPFSDLADQNGTIPEQPTQPPCTSSVVDDSVTTIEGAYACLSENCSTGGGSGVTKGGTDCYSGKCASALAGFDFGTHEQQVCFNCIIANGLSYVSWDENKRRCTTEVGHSFAFQGTATSLMMSKHPLNNPDQYVIQTALFRRVALYARMEYEPGAEIDVYCVHAPPALGGTLPYSGDYGNGASAVSGAGWLENQIWGIKGVVEWIKKKSKDRPAIIVGDWSASATVLDANGQVIVDMNMLPVLGDVNRETINVVRAAFTEAIPNENYKPQCTRCPEAQNAYNEGLHDPQLNLRVYIKDPWVPNTTTATSRFYDDTNAVQIDSAKYGTFGAYSDTFGYNVQIRRPQ
jgi:hypothetical protein